MTDRGLNLIDRPQPILEEALQHPWQLEACEVIEDLIGDLRGADSTDDLMRFEVQLFGVAIRAQQRQASAAANAKRERAGKPTPASEGSTWEIDRIVADRVVRQVRSIGDALAWKSFDYDRRVFLTYSRNNPVGPMVERRGRPKEGLEFELQAVEQFWHEEGRFALLHDLTSAMRLGDVTLFTERGPVQKEIKKGARGGPQFRRLEEAKREYERGSVIDDDGLVSESIQSEVPFRTRLKSLGKVLSLADHQGTASIAIARHWVVTAVSLTAEALRGQEFPHELLRQQRELSYTKAGMHTSDRHLRGLYVDVAAVSAWTPPHALLPFSPDVCARLTCDLLTFVPCITYERLEGAFSDRGFFTECLLPPDRATVRGETPVMSARKGPANLTIHWSGMGQFLYEMLEVSVYAEACDVLLRSGRSHPGRGLIIYANEKAAWR